MALIVRNTLPNGESRAAIVHRTLGDDAEAFGAELLIAEAGVHDIMLQVARRDLDGELTEVRCLSTFVAFENTYMPACATAFLPSVLFFMRNPRKFMR